MTPRAARRSRPRSSPPFAPLSGNSGTRFAASTLDSSSIVPVEVAEHFEPFEDVAAAVPARRARVAPDRQDDVAPGEGQLECELLPRRTGADDEDGPVGEQGRPPVVGGVQ